MSSTTRQRGTSCLPLWFQRYSDFNTLWPQSLAAGDSNHSLPAAGDMITHPDRLRCGRPCGLAATGWQTTAPTWAPAVLPRLLPCGRDVQPLVIWSWRSCLRHRLLRLVRLHLLACRWPLFSLGGDPCGGSHPTRIRDGKNWPRCCGHGQGSGCMKAVAPYTERNTKKKSLWGKTRLTRECNADSTKHWA